MIGTRSTITRLYLMKHWAEVSVHLNPGTSRAKYAAETAMAGVE